MTFAPETIKAVRRYLKGKDADLDDVELGIVGGPSHILTGTSYHLGADQLKMWKDPYSARTFRDSAGLSDAASGLDIDDDLDELRELSVWLVAECRRSAPDTLDIREIIYSPDGVLVLHWDRERGVTSAPFVDDQPSHRTHTHVSWYRDSEFRDKTAVFKRFFGDDMDWSDRFGNPGMPGDWKDAAASDYLRYADYHAELAARRAGAIETKVDKLAEGVAAVAAALAELKGGITVPAKVGLTDEALDAVEARQRDVEADALEAGAAGVRAEQS